MNEGTLKLSEVLEAMLTERLTSQTLRNASGRTIGRIAMSGPVATLEDSTGRVRGTYDMRDNTTRDHTGRKVGSGNLLGTLLIAP